MVLIVPMMLVSLAAKHIKKVAEENDARRARAASMERTEGWVVMQPGDSIDIPLEKITTPVKLKGIWFFSFSFPGDQPADVYADVIGDGVPFRDTPQSRQYIKHKPGENGSVVVRGGKGLWRVTMSGAP
ncbi:MAG: hypothetical protein WC246_00405 [Candidatus Paceibacterota bacterium]|jgi:hypothetical protein